ncbi:hypothetical protein H4219_000399 [Mycoemilia scoparia]|uniref:NADH dehydrogenase [ubiquinone] iron-sulfur protein 5 n=1 Tax=Mycoemilia scoparia TaxID=417184 RepID=A0A9W8A2X0_9FUNG|nr:hypothetical protein H4219_000399 [Mycoemilia scoparia]
MASGFGYQGRNRCFEFWQEFKKCYILSEDPVQKDCVPLRDDYVECLHSFKEIARVQKIQAVEQEKLKKGELKPREEEKLDPRFNLRSPVSA